ncbi:MAG TPA: hypothetical protein VFS43_03750 [Polyangiaceae bacterium]|nr:hypothetical protein [Polyangiaceae bacterium]
MKLTRAEMCLLLSFLYETSDDEITCDDALEGFAALAEAELRGGGVSARTAAIAEHVAECPECAEEYASLLAAIAAAAPPPG